MIEYAGVDGHKRVYDLIKERMPRTTTRTKCENYRGLLRWMQPTTTLLCEIVKE